MNTPQGWARAKLKLKGLDLDRNSLLEAYYTSALQKEHRIESKKVLALMSVIAGSDKKQEAVRKYIEELFPVIGEDRKDFKELGEEVLEDLAGKVVTFDES